MLTSERHVFLIEQLPFLIGMHPLWLFEPGLPENEWLLVPEVYPLVSQMNPAPEEELADLSFSGWHTVQP